MTKFTVISYGKRWSKCKCTAFGTRNAAVNFIVRESKKLWGKAWKEQIGMTCARLAEKVKDVLSLNGNLHRTSRELFITDKERKCLEDAHWAIFCVSTENC